MGGRTGNGEADSPVALFGLLANETRMAAMQSLWEAERPLTFSEVARQAGVEDTGNFSYHLERLQPNFVRKVKDEYALTRAGQRVLTAVLAGRFTEHGGFDRTTVDYACPFCAAPIVLELGEDALRVACTECPGIYRGRAGDERITKVWLPPAGVREDPTATLDAALQWTFTRNWAFARGVCPECGGGVEVTPELCPDHDSGNGLCGACGGRYGVIARYRCGSCQESLSIVALFPLLTDRRVRSFFYDHGHDPTAFTFESVTAAFPYEETVVDRNPLRFELRENLGAETLVVTGDRQFAVGSLDRRKR